MTARRPRRRPARLARKTPALSLLCLLLCAPALAERVDSQDLPCGLVESGSIHVDGLSSDWEGVPAVDLPVRQMETAKAAPTGRPLRARVRCNYDDRAMYLLIEVDDDAIVRTRAAALAEDHVELAFASGSVVERLLLWPALYSSKIPRGARWSSGRGARIIEGEGPAGRAHPLSGPPAVEVYDALQRRGYLFELRLPLRALPGYKPGVPLPMGIRVVDVDSHAHPEPVAVAESGELDRPAGLPRVLLAEAQAGLDALLQDLHASPSDIWWEASGDVGSGPARVVMIGRSLAVVAKEYGWKDVAPSRADVKDVQLVDIGEGRKAVAVRAAEAGGGGAREVLRLYRLSGGDFQVVFAAEVAKRAGAAVLGTQVSYVRRGKAVDIVLVPQPAVGTSEATWAEAPADDVAPILLPWRDRKARYVWKGTGYSRLD